MRNACCRVFKITRRLGEETISEPDKLFQYVRPFGRVFLVHTWFAHWYCGYEQPSGSQRQLKVCPSMLTSYFFGMSLNAAKYNSGSSFSWPN